MLVALAADEVAVRVVDVRPLELAALHLELELRQVRAGEMRREVGGREQSVPSERRRTRRVSASRRPRLTPADAHASRARRSDGRVTSARVVLSCGRRRLDRGDVDLPHLEHRRHRPLGLLLVRVREQLDQPRGNDLPREAEAILQPAARAFLAALRERRPVAVDLLLVGAVDLERDRLVERELGAAVQRDELLPVELEPRRPSRCRRRAAPPRRSGRRRRSASSGRPSCRTAPPPPRRCRTTGRA